MSNGQLEFINGEDDISFDSEITPYCNINTHHLFSNSMSDTFSSLHSHSSSDVNEYCIPEAYISEVSRETYQNTKEKMVRNKELQNHLDWNHSDVFQAWILQDQTSEILWMNNKNWWTKEEDLSNDTVVISHKAYSTLNSSKAPSVQIKMNMICTWWEKCKSNKHDYGQKINKNKDN